MAAIGVGLPEGESVGQRFAFGAVEVHLEFVADLGMEAGSGETPVMLEITSTTNTVLPSPAKT
ncbi:hypothetical protein [Actinacidiphila rubida]|uniref:hypothetical protein n=1 Tax=Actinacidiphila rubida TaxID=310780 RepID=UPI00114CC0AB|nr:hypothetical protein [Actinacidiphila rubida]